MEITSVVEGGSMLIPQGANVVETQKKPELPCSSALLLTTVCVIVACGQDHCCQPPRGKSAILFSVASMPSGIPPAMATPLPLTGGEFKCILALAMTLNRAK